jgi:hypothetical protein
LLGVNAQGRLLPSLSLKNLTLRLPLRWQRGSGEIGRDEITGERVILKDGIYMGSLNQSPDYNRI